MKLLCVPLLGAPNSGTFKNGKEEKDADENERWAVVSSVAVGVGVGGGLNGEGR